MHKLTNIYSIENKIYFSDIMASKDFEWFVNANLDKYKGEYVVIFNEKIVLHGKDLSGLLKEFRKKNPNITPKVAQIPTEETLIL